jgi:hypothetical protein
MTTGQSAAAVAVFVCYKQAINAPVIILDKAVYSCCGGGAGSVNAAVIISVMKQK